MSEFKTKLGAFRQDKAGIWHYGCRTLPCHVSTALDDALSNRPIGATWFWWLDTPAPMYEGDTVQMLYTRWDKWREDFLKDHQSLLHNLYEEATGEKAE